MSRTLVAKSITYEFTLDNIRNLIATDLMVDPIKVDVEYVLHEVGGDPMDRFPGRKEVKCLKVTVKD